MIPGFDSRYWDGVYPEGYEYQFVYIKATEADNFVAQPQLNLQTNGAKANGILRGYYHFYRYHYDPIKQAEYFFDKCPADAELPPVLDLEDGQASPSLANVTRIRDLAAKVEELFGQPPMIYTAAWWWNTRVWPYLPASGWNYQKLDLWVANYTQAVEPYMPLGWGSWQVWQHIGDWSAPGFNAKIDVNRAKEDWFAQFTNGNTPDPKEGILKETNCIEINIKKIRKLLEDL